MNNLCRTITTGLFVPFTFLLLMWQLPAVAMVWGAHLNETLGLPSVTTTEGNPILWGESHHPFGNQSRGNGTFTPYQSANKPQGLSDNNALKQTSKQQTNRFDYTSNNYILYAGLRDRMSRYIKKLRHRNGAPKRGFRDKMSPNEEARYNKYWKKHAPGQSRPYDMRRRYNGDSTTKQVTTYDKYGRRHRQYDLNDGRRGEHQHNFEYGPKYPKGTRSDHQSINE